MRKQKQAGKETHRNLYFRVRQAVLIRFAEVTKVIIQVYCNLNYNETVLLTIIIPLTRTNPATITTLIITTKEETIGNFTVQYSKPKTVTLEKQ